MNSLINQDQDIDWNERASCINNSIGNHEIAELKGYFIPKGLVPLEILFSKDDTILKPTIQSIEENVLSYNIGSENELKVIKISKTHS